MSTPLDRNSLTEIPVDKTPPITSKNTDTANVKSKTVNVGTGTPFLKTNTNSNIPERSFEQWMYEFNLSYIRPDGKKIDITDFIQSFSYMMDFDELVMPIFTSIIIVPDEVSSDIKKYFEELKFILNVKKFLKSQISQGIEGEYIKKENVFENKILRTIDPQYLDLMPQQGEEGSKNQPRRRIKLDFIYDKSCSLNFAVQSRVFSNVKVIDVIMQLLNEAAKQEKESNPEAKDPFKIVVTPPDNNDTYEQIILDPGTITENIYMLQEKYGVYKTGIRTFFNSSAIQIDPVTKKPISYRLLSVTDKSTSTPADGTINKVLIEIVELGSSNNFYNPSGSTIDNDTQTLICRTIFPYQLIKKNSTKLIHGESVRLVGSSQKQHACSICDIKNTKSSMQRTFWQNNDNKYALTALQDDIKEKEATIMLRLDNIDVLSFSNNLEYTLKFLNTDDTAYSGVYRLTAVKFDFRAMGIRNKDFVEISSVFNFSNIPPIIVDDEEEPRQSYEEKLDKASSDQSSTYTPVNMNGKNTTEVPFKQNTGSKGPFKVAFPGNTDNNGNVVPSEISASYPMSKHIIFEDIYVTKDGTDVNKAYGMCQDFKLFMSAQIFSKNILDPFIDKWGKFKGGGGRPNSFFRYSVPSGGSRTSAHLLALAIDIAVTPGVGDSLCEPYLWLVQNKDALNFDQIILEGNGNSWRWIHIGYKINGTNRKQCLYFRGPGSRYTAIDIDSFTMASKASFNNISSIA